MHAFDVLGDPVRRRILEMLAGEEMTAGDVVRVVGEKFGISQPAVSQHLKVLRDAGLERWLAPVSGDLELGGRYQVEGNASGEVVACEPPRSFTVTWEFAGDYSHVGIQIVPEGEGARLTLEHEHTGDADSEFCAQFGPGATGVGWDLALLGLALHLAGTDRPAEPEATAAAGRTTSSFLGEEEGA